MLSRLMTPREQMILVGLLGAILLGAATLWYRGPDSAPEAVVSASDASTAKIEEETPEVKLAKASDEAQVVSQAADEMPAEAAPKEIAVAVMGAVEEPGLYRVDSDARVRDLLLAAGGPLPAAALREINRLARLIDGTTLTVPGQEDARAKLGLNPPQYLYRDSGYMQAHTGYSRGYATNATAPPHFQAGSAAGNGRIDINTAAAAELESLSGIGPVLAQRIIDYRRRQPFRRIEELMQVSGIGPKTLEKLRGNIVVR